MAPCKSTYRHAVYRSCRRRRATAIVTHPSRVWKFFHAPRARSSIAASAAQHPHLQVAAGGGQPQFDKVIVHFNLSPCSPGAGLSQPYSYSARSAVSLDLQPALLLLQQCSAPPAAL
eukprot:TRINITY_DN4313_c1_g1_i1.p3 TRINITY_DN4313_c1_g1~~TRINITY_DN4313_c1_g1_i1.p3  ORF type:complete len:117 (-),score=13.38 TRINITY_DN4313_c1_g1_i1:753-1103(-)